MSLESGAGFQPAAAGHLARVPSAGWKPKLAGKMPAPLLLAVISPMTARATPQSNSLSLNEALR